MKINPGLRTVGLLLTCGLLAGCGGGAEDRLNFSGKATFEGQPIVYGTVTFLPDEGAGHKGPTGTATIVNGEYDTSKEGSQGVLPGAHVLRITAYPAPLNPSTDETVPTKQVEPLFVNYEMKADLKEETFDITVPAEARGSKPKGEQQRPGQNANVP